MKKRIREIVENQKKITTGNIISAIIEEIEHNVEYPYVEKNEKEAIIYFDIAEKELEVFKQKKLINSTIEIDLLVKKIIIEDDIAIVEQKGNGKIRVKLTLKATEEKVKFLKIKKNKKSIGFEVVSDNKAEIQTTKLIILEELINNLRLLNEKIKVKTKKDTPEKSTIECNSYFVIDEIYKTLKEYELLENR